MLSSQSFSYLPLLVAVTLVSCCSKAPALPFCSLLSANLSLLSKEEPLPTNISLADEYSGRNLTIFRQLSFDLPTDLSTPAASTYTFTLRTSYGRQGPPQGEILEPSIAFIFARYPLRAKAPSTMQYMELIFLCNRRLRGCAIPIIAPCNTPPQQQPVAVYSSSVDEDDADLLMDEVSLAYDARTAALRVHVVDYRDGFQNKVTFNLSTTLPGNESTTFFVGYITNGHASIHVAPTTLSSPPQASLTPTSLSRKHDSKTNGESHNKHIELVAWVVVGTLMMGTLLGLIILVIFIKKHRGRRPVLGSSTLGNGSTPLVRRSPFTHRDLESSVTPMMSTAPPLQPIHSEAFQISGTASWLKQPSPPR